MLIVLVFVVVSAFVGVDGVGVSGVGVGGTSVVAVGVGIGIGVGVGAVGVDFGVGVGAGVGVDDVGVGVGVGVSVVGGGGGGGVDAPDHVQQADQGLQRLPRARQNERDPTREAWRRNMIRVFGGSLFLSSRPTPARRSMSYAQLVARYLSM